MARPGARWIPALAWGALALAAGGCGANHSAADGAAPAPDTVRGVVAITGADPATAVVVRPPGGAAVRLEGAAADALRDAAGLDVRVSGRRGAGGELVVESFRVRGLDGIPAADGRLELDADAVVLVTPAGERLRYPAAPPALRALAGRHVWIAGEPGAEPQQWGSLGPDR